MSNGDFMKMKIFIILIVAAMLVVPLYFAFADDAAVLPYTFPILHLTADNHPFDMERTEWHGGTLTLSNTTRNRRFYDAAVQIRGRGNATWWRGFDKKPLRIRFEQPRHLLGAAYAHSDWILLANHFDASLMRNRTAFYLSNLLSGLDFQHTSHFVHVYINGAYKGVYELTDERSIGPGRLPLTIHADPTVSEYFIELDRHVTNWLAHANTEGIDYFLIDDVPYNLRLPRLNERNGHFEYAYAFIKNAKKIIHTHDYVQIKKIIDIPSFIDFYIINELMKNADIDFSSLFMSIRGQGENRRLFFGPVWDFDYSSANTLDPEPSGFFVGENNVWMRELLATPEIFTRVVSRWNEIKDVEIAQTLAHIESISRQYINEFLRNFEQHNILGTAMSPSPYRVWAIDCFENHVYFLLYWLQHRITWLDAFFNGYVIEYTPLFPFHTQEAALEYFHYFQFIKATAVTLTVDAVVVKPDNLFFIFNNRVYISTMDVNSIFAVNIEFNPEKGFFTINNNKLYENIYVLNIMEHRMEPATPHDTELFLPLRTVTDFLGYGISFCSATRTVFVTTN